jgi:hypothetical protein
MIIWNDIFVLLEVFKLDRHPCSRLRTLGGGTSACMGLLERIPMSYIKLRVLLVSFISRDQISGIDHQHHESSIHS